jgi:hypothetical protein
VSVADVEGDTPAARFAAAVERLEGKPGVVYFPAGTYVFEETLHIPDGVILRGADPAGPASARDPAYALETRFEFPKYAYSAQGAGTPNDTAFKRIETDPLHSGVGVVNIAINRASIHFGEAKDHKTGPRKLVFGCVLRNTAGVARDVPHSNPAYGQLPHQRWTARHLAAIHVYGADLFIANNRMPKSGGDNFVMKDYVVVTPTGDRNEQDFRIRENTEPGEYRHFTIPELVFDYDNRPGIYANAFGIGGWGRERKYGTPETHPWGFRKGIIIRDNYIYCSGRCAVHFTGDGTYMGFNQIRYPEGLTRPTTVGLTLADGSSTNDNRACTARGYRWVIEGNVYEVHSNRALRGQKINDGEGLMHENHANSMVKGARMINNEGNRYLCLWVMDIDGLLIEGNKVSAGGSAVHVLSGSRDIKDVVIRGNELTSGSISVTAATAKNLVIEDNKLAGSITVATTGATEAIAVASNRHLGEKSSVISLTDTGWADASNEGFTVEQHVPREKRRKK